MGDGGLVSSEELAEDVEGDDECGGEEALEPGEWGEGLDGEGGAAEGDEEELEGEEESRDEEEGRVFGESSEGVEVGGAGVEAVEGDGHHEGGEDGGGSG